MSKTPLYRKIAEAVRQEIVSGSLKPEDDLPTVRDMAVKWHCAPGTVLRAYQELAEQELVISRPGSGTRVAPEAFESRATPLRRARLVHQAESFILSAVTSGYTLREIEPALQLALDRYRTLEEETPPQKGQGLRFVGSHDPAISLLATRLAEKGSGPPLQLSFAGSLGGLIALARKKAHIAGAHLWDVETDSYNRSYVRRFLPGQRIALVNLADRHIGLIVASGNPLNITDLGDLVRPDVRFINRQREAGTRVWLDVQLRNLGLESAQIAGYTTEAHTHIELASAIYENLADVGLGIEAAALAYGLDFILLTTERYDLIIPGEEWERETIHAMIAMLQTGEMKKAIDLLGGYETSHTGTVEWVD